MRRSVLRARQDWERGHLRSGRPYGRRNRAFPTQVSQANKTKRGHYVYKHEVAVELAGGKRLVFETGRMAKQASGAALVSTGETVVLATAVASPDPREGIDFFPLTVDYREYTYAGGRIPGGFIKREGRPSEKEILTCRQIDRPMRPLFPDGFRNETQVIALVFSADKENDPDVIGNQRRGRGCGSVRHSVQRHGWRGARGPRERRVRGQSHLRRARRNDGEHHGCRPQGRHRDDRVGRQGRDRRGDSGGHRVCATPRSRRLSPPSTSWFRRPASRSGRLPRRSSTRLITTS